MIIEVLVDAVRHNVWASKALIAVCGGLTVEQLHRPAPGFGSILATFNHVVGSDAGYVSALGGVRATWESGADTEHLDELEARVDETARAWELLLAEPFNAERVLVLDEGTYETYAGVVIAQALHHGSVHREQICACFKAFGLEPPDVQPWGYADATGRSR